MKTHCWNCDQVLADEPDGTTTNITTGGTVGLFYCSCLTVNRIDLDLVAEQEAAR